MSMPPGAPLFAVTLVLVIVDAAVGYLLAPLLVRPLVQAPARLATTRSLRRLLALMVAVYSFLACFAYFQGRSLLAKVVLCLVLLDLGLQLLWRWRLEHRGDDSDHDGDV